MTIELFLIVLTFIIYLIGVIKSLYYIMENIETKNLNKYNEWLSWYTYYKLKKNVRN